MFRGLETLLKMLALEEQDYQYQDRAVSGGLARYAETWRRQAQDAYGSAAEIWINDVVRRLETYSTLDPEARIGELSVLRDILQADPQEFNPAVFPSQVQAEAPKASPVKAETRSGLDAPVRLIKSVGKQKATALANLHVESIGDLLHLYPRRYDDYSQLKTINHLVPGEKVSVLATVWEVSKRPTRNGKPMIKAILSDNTGTIEVTYFNQAWREKDLKPNTQVVVSGKVDEYLGRLTMNSPQIETLNRNLNNVTIQPVYPLTEGLKQNFMRKIMRSTVSAWAPRIPDPLPQEMQEKHKLLPLSQALAGIHFPESQEHLAKARRRLAFEEVLYLQLGLLQQKMTWKSEKGQTLTFSPEMVASYTAALPYTLTGAQQRSLAELLEDLATGQPMNRLLQGDVGSGKTVVAALLMALVASQGHQAALMAPTEILAEQHYKNISMLLSSFPEPLLILRLLTGSTSQTDRDEIYAGLADGSVDLVVGTHALIQESVSFNSLVLAIIDEQHRFGVHQRGTLRSKGINPHLLVMTATPIPRSLELTVWGHLDVSILDEMPPGREPVKTRVLNPRERER
ncbi:MAG: ATP-dependent DNA helicase RecG, partial [Anaerolineae bacterium]|nr:ATP-dependent DNA helicase RecG [Anaerolineae bacterium]